LAGSLEHLNGYDVDESAARLGNVLAVLREVVHRSSAWLALEPHLEVKYALGDHIHDDACAVTELRARLTELGHAPDAVGAPAEEPAVLLDRASEAMNSGAYLAVVYGELKPALVGALQAQLDQLDTLVEEPSLRLLTELLHRQERHAVELGGGTTLPPSDDLAPSARPGVPRPLTVGAPVLEPARDPYVEIALTGEADALGAGGVGGRRLHDLMDAAVVAAELTARTSHEQPDLPWEFHADAARLVWDHLRHAQIHERLMATELGCRWGDHPVDVVAFRSIAAQDPAGRLALLHGTDDHEPARRLTHRHEALGGATGAQVAASLDHLLADERRHVQVARRWGVLLLDGDEAAYRARAERAGEPA
jgi:Protein of unknown function (DUF455)